MGHSGRRREENPCILLRASSGRRPSPTASLRPRTLAEVPAGLWLPGQPQPMRAPVDPRWPTRRIFAAAFTAGTAVLLAYVLLSAVGSVAGELLLLVLALVFALGLDPLVSWLVVRGMRRTVGVAAVTAAFLVLLGGVFAAVIPPIVAQVDELVHAAPGLIQELQDRNSVVGRLNAKYHVLDAIRAQLSGGSGKLPLGGVLNIGLAVFGTLAATVSASCSDLLPGQSPVDPPFAVPDGAGEPARPGRGAGRRDQRPRRRLRAGRPVTSAVAGVGTFVFLEIVQVPYAVALGVLVAVLDLIPVVGSTIGGVLVTLVALSVSTPVAIAP